MRIEKIERKLFTFDELTDKAKETAREWFRTDYPEYEWWDGVYMDADNIGLKIKEFDIDRGAHVEAVFIESAEETAHKIEKEHGETCETFTDAKNYLKERDALLEAAPRDEGGDFVDEYELDNQLDALDVEFLRTLQEDYRIMLQKEYEYLLSDESIDENIRINEYEFLENGEVA